MSISEVQNALLESLQCDTAIDEIFAAQLPGTLTSETTSVSGIGTTFTDFVAEDGTVKITYIGDKTKGYRKVMTVISDSLLTVKSAFKTEFSNGTFYRTEIKKGIPDELNISEVGQTMRVGFISAAPSDVDVPGSKVAMHYGFLIAVGFKDPDEDRAEDRKSEIEQAISNCIDKDPTFALSKVLGTTSPGQMKFSSSPFANGIYVGAVPLVITRHETRGSR